MSAELDMKKCKNIVTSEYIKMEKEPAKAAIKGLNEYMTKLDEPLPSKEVKEQIVCSLCKTVFTSKFEKSKHI